MLRLLLVAVLLAWSILAFRAFRRGRAWAPLARRADAVRRGRLEARLPDRSRQLVAGPGWLAARLRVAEGKAVISRERGGKRGSPLSRARATTTGPPDLTLESEGGATIAIIGPVRVRVGSKQRFGAGVTRSLKQGDRVIARGVLEATTRGGDYRSAGEKTWSLRPEGEAVDLAALGEVDNRLAPALAFAAFSAHPATLTVLVCSTAFVLAINLYAAGKAYRASACQSEPSCAQEGLCGARWQSFGFVCGAEEESDCVGSAACRDDNRCAARDGVCSVVDCSPSCGHNGACVPRGTQCFVASDADCEQSWVCRQRGLCTERKGRCVLTVDENRDCSHYVTCRSHGHCSSTPKGCLAATVADCRQSEDCRIRGRCSPDGFGLCRALSDDDCKHSDHCRVLGLCKAIDQGCALSAEDKCGATTECDYRAKCALVDGRCVPTREEHCKLSSLCAVYELCRLVGEECVE